MTITLTSVVPKPVRTLWPIAISDYFPEIPQEPLPSRCPSDRDAVSI